MHSFEFWFQALEGYLSGTTYGHQADTSGPPLADALEETTSHIGVGAVEHERLGRAYLESVARLGFAL